MRTRAGYLWENHEDHALRNAVFRHHHWHVLQDFELQISSLCSFVHHEVRQRKLVAHFEE